MNYLLSCRLEFKLMFFTAVENKQVVFKPEVNLGPEKNLEKGNFEHAFVTRAYQPSACQLNINKSLLS